MARGLRLWLALVAIGVLALFFVDDAGSSARTAPAPAWLTFGAGPGRLGAAPATAGKLTRRFVLPVSGRVTGQVLAAGGSFFAATTSGELVSFDANGFVHWRDDLGQLAMTCPQLDGYGLVGTGVIDPVSRTLYIADAFGRLHALALATGVERAGWPVRVLAGFRSELNWGALTLADGAVYVPTGSYCDTPGTPGSIYRVAIGSRTVSPWLAVPLELGGGGGPWGWGGLAFDPAENSLFAATSGAFSAAKNVGAAFTETAGYGDRLVELGPDLSVAGASHPADLPDRKDLDFVGSPLLIRGTSCGSLVVAGDKDDTLYGWREDALAAGPAWEVSLEAYDQANPFLTNLAWSQETSSLYAVTGTELVRIGIGAGCTAKVVWRRPLGTKSENGSPTVSGNTVWFAVNGADMLVGYNATTGVRVFRASLAGTTLEAPTIVDHRLVVGTFTGLIDGFSLGSQGPARTSASAAAEAAGGTSWADARNGWQSRASGVYATSNAGRSWQRIYPHPAIAALRTSKTAGLISTGFSPGACMCTTKQLWTTDNGRTWHESRAISGNFAADRGHIYDWVGGNLRLVTNFPPAITATELRTKVLSSTSSGTIVQAADTAAGLAVLVTNRVNGQGWDNSPHVIIARGAATRTVALPSAPGYPLARTIAAAGSKVTVTAVDDTSQPAHTVTWMSNDSGSTWTIHS